MQIKITTAFHAFDVNMSGHVIDIAQRHAAHTEAVSPAHD
jgi:hypothetical protein